MNTELAVKLALSGLFMGYIAITLLGLDIWRK